MSNLLGHTIYDIEKLNNGSIHNFSLGTLDCYFYLSTSPSSLNNGILRIGGRNPKAFVFKGSSPDINTLITLRPLMPIYSVDPITGLQGGRKFHELVYNLADVMNPTSYANAKKRHRRLHYPNVAFRKHDFLLRELNINDLAAVTELHSNWVGRKMSDPKTYKIMFPKARYLRCMTIGLNDPNRYLCLGAFNASGELLACRCLYRRHTEAYDLSNFSMPIQGYADFSEHFSFLCMKYLFEHEVGTINCGCGLTKLLTAFKNHWPSHHIVSYAYSQTKE